jgi:aerobic carbon-monoxide dehydrogenase medium subunit
MLPARFEYHRPETLDEAIGLLHEHGEEAKVLAGGMSFIPLMKLRFATPGHVVDVNRIADLNGISESDGWLRIRAVTRHNELANADLIKSRYPAMAAAAPQIADPIVRNLGTIAGSLAHGDPAGDWGSVMLALGGQVLARSSSSERTIPVEELFVSNFATNLEPDEIITEVQVPMPEPRSGGAYLKLERKVGDFATVGVAVQLSLDDGQVKSAGIGLTAVGPTNIKGRDAEARLVGSDASDEVVAEAGKLAAQAAQPMSDLRGSEEYKRHVVEVFVRRGVARALEIARGG